MDKRIQKSHQSLIALKSLLDEIIKEPESFINDSEINVALESQGLLAKYSDTLKGIIPSSINTHKRIADTLFSGGYDAFNKLRLSAQSSIERKVSENRKPDRETKTGLKLIIEKIENEKQSLRQDLLLLTLAFEKSLNQSTHYASRADATIQALCKKEQRELLNMLSLRKHVINSNVISISDDQK